MKNELKLKFLKDNPVLSNSKDYYDFYHKYISPSLSEILENETKIQTIGLFGSWGSGKSTIIKNLEIEYSSKYPVFIFDAWKYQADPLRRTFLINLFKYINEKRLWAQKLKPPDNFLDVLYEDSFNSQEVPLESKTPKTPLEKIFSPIKNIFKNNPFSLVLYILLVATLILWILAQYFLGENNPIISFLLKIPGILSLSLIGTGFFTITSKTIIENLTKLLFEDLRNDVKTQTLIKHRDYLNSPEQFENKFREIINRISTKIVIVFDNVDRVQGDVAIETLKSIKTFIDPDNNEKIVFIVPCDAEAIINQISLHYPNLKDPSEYLRKLFNVVVWTPDFINTDLEEFTSSLIKELGNGSSILSNDELVLVINYAFRSNPREIKQFLNNLIAALIIAQKTEVWDDVQENIPYLAKVLILKQKFPEAYKRLKEKWYEPEKIYGILDNEEEGLSDFMVNTSRVTVQNAEPFLYYKKPNQIKGIQDSEKLSAELLKGNLEETEKIITKNKNNISKVADLILTLYKQYRSQPNWMTNIFKTQALIFTKLNINISATRFYNDTLEVIDRYLWQSFTLLPTSIIFKDYINNKKVKTSLKNNVIGRYVTALSNKSVTTNSVLAEEIVQNLTETDIVQDEAVSTFRKNIEDSYSTAPQVIKLFKSYTLQNKYVTAQTINKIISAISHDNFQEWLPVLLLYKRLINENNFGQILIDKLIVITQEENARWLGENPGKQVLIEMIAEFIKEPSTLLKSATVTGIDNLNNNIVFAYARIGTPIDSKYYFLPTFYLLKSSISQSLTPQTDNIIRDFIRTADATVINDKVLITLDKLGRKSEFISQYIDAIKDRGVASRGESLGNLYLYANKKEQQEIINALINQRGDLGFSFIHTLTNLPARQETLVTMLQRLNSVAISDREPYYEWLISKINISDESSIKQGIVSHIINLVKNDGLLEEELGYKLFIKSKFLSDTYKRDIAKEVIAWLRTPGKKVQPNNRFALKTVAYIFSDLQITSKSDFIFVLFELLDNQNDKPSIEVALETLKEIKPKWIDFEKDFTDYKEKLLNWTNALNRNFVIEELLKLQPQRCSTKEKTYWQDLSKLTVTTSQI